MPKIDDKVHLIGSAITSQAEQERAAIIEKANQIREKELAEYKEQVIGEMFGRMQHDTREVRQHTVQQKAQTASQASRELLLRREELAAQVFAAVRARLAEYVAGEEYRAALLERVRAVKDQWDHTASVVQLREADMALAAQIQSLLPGCEVRAAKRIKIGGFELRNSAAGILLDETLDARLDDQRPWFLQNCGLKAS